MDNPSPQPAQLLLAAPKAEEVEKQYVEQQDNRNFDWLKEYQWQKGQSGNPKGRPRGKTLKEFAREFLWNMSDEARLAYMVKANPEFVWRMAEGNPHQSQDVQMTGVITHQVVGMNVNREIKKADARLIPKPSGADAGIQDAQR